jgi:hypothetical protein
VDSATAETHVRLLAEAQLRRAGAVRGHQPAGRDPAGGPDPPEQGMLTVSAVLTALDQAGALSRETARLVGAEFAAALAVRGWSSPRALLGWPSLGGPGLATGPRPAAGPPSRPPGGRYRAVPVGVAARGELGGQPGLAYLHALVLAPGRAAITMTYLPAWPPPAGRAGQPSFPPFGGGGLTDDRGRRYALTFGSHESGWHEGGVLDLSPVPPADTRWLDLPVRPGRVARIDITGADQPGTAGPVSRTGQDQRGTDTRFGRTSVGQPARVSHVPVAPGVGQPARVSHVPVVPGAVGDLLLDAVAESLLGGGPLGGIEARLLATSLDEVAAALSAAGALAPGSLAVRRLAALCQRRAIDVPGRLAARAVPADLPGPWASVLAPGRDRDGPEGAAPVAAVLPEIDGARIVLAGLVSWERRAILPGFAWGWPPGGQRFCPEQPLSWWARDDAGRWHVGRTTVPDDAGRGDFHLELTPPLHPGAKGLDIIVTGRASRVTATLPLGWLPPGELGQ